MEGREKGTRDRGKEKSEGRRVGDRLARGKKGRKGGSGRGREGGKEEGRRESSTKSRRIS